MQRIAMALAGVAALCAPVQGAACSVIAVPEIKLEGPPPDWRDDCRAAMRDMGAYVADLRDGGLGHGDFVAVARAMREGAYGCRKRPARALELVDLGMGSPVTERRGSPAMLSYLEWTSDDPASERRAEVVIGSWIANNSRDLGFCATYYEDALPPGQTEAEVLRWLLRPEYWEIALHMFGNNPARDRLVLRQMIDPGSDRFDLAAAGELASRFGNQRDAYLPEDVQFEVAEAVADPRLGTPDYEAAARVLGPHSFYTYPDSSTETIERARRLWVRIAQTRLTDPDPAVRRQAAFMLGAGDPAARPGIPFEAVLPAGSTVIELEGWPAGLPPILNLAGAAGRISEQYPSRALRQGQAGRVELGLLFRPDGSFRSVHVTRSAGEVLDQAAIRGATRYLRPKLEEMRLEGFEGRYVYVPLPAFEYRMLTVIDDQAAGLSEGGQRIVIPGQWLRRSF